MSTGEIIGLLAVVALIAFVAVVAVPLVKLGKTVDELTLTVRELRTQHVAKSVTTVDETNTLLASTNMQLERVDAITKNAQQVTDNAAAMSSLFSATLGGPLVKTAAFTYGVRQAIASRRNGNGHRSSSTNGRHQR